MTPGQLQTLQGDFLILGLIGAGLIALGLVRIFVSRFVAAWRLIAELQKPGGVQRVNARTWDLAESVDPVRDIGDGRS